MDKEEHKLKNIAVSKEMAVHYEKIFESMFNECINKLPDELEIICMAFGVNKTKLTMDACRKVLAKYDEAAKRVQDSSQTDLFPKEGS